jgi:predicted amidohydrolase
MVRVGAVQAEPAWFDLEGSVNKTIALIEEAGRDKVDVLGFPEVFIPGYPWYVCPKTRSSLSNNVYFKARMDTKHIRTCRADPQIHGEFA